MIAPTAHPDRRGGVLEFEPGTTWRARLHDAGASDATLIDAVTTSVHALFTRLGLPDPPAVTMAPAMEGRTPLRVRLDGRRLRAPRALARDLLAASPGDPVAALCLLVRTAAELRPAELLDDAAARRVTDGLGDAASRPDAAVILRSLLEQGIALADTAAIAAGFAAARRADATADEAAEIIASRARTDAIDVEMSVAYARSIGIPLADRPLWFRDVGALRAHDAELPGLVRGNMGVSLPPLRCVVRDDLPDGYVAVRINHASGTPRRAPRAGERLVNATAGYLDEQDVAFEPMRHPLSGVRCGAIDAGQEPHFAALGIAVWEAPAVVALITLGDVLARAWQLFDLTQLEREFARIETTVPAAVDAALEHTTIPRFAAIVRWLLRGRAPMIDLPGIIEHIVGYQHIVAPLGGGIPFAGPLALDPTVAPPPFDRPRYVARYLRKRMARILSSRLLGDSAAVNVLMLDSDDEAATAAALAAAHDRRPDRFHAIADALDEALERVDGGNSALHLFTDARIAADLGVWLAPEFPHVQVLTFDDVTPTTPMRPAERLALMP